jgi:molecular chaperone GrpE
MTDEKSADAEETSLKTAEGPAEGPADGPTEGPAEKPAAEMADPDAALAELNEEIVALKDQALRAQAEVENVRRRATRDVENAHKYALERFTGDLLPVLDSLEKAVEASSAAAELASDPNVAIAHGVDLSLKLFLDVLGRFGIAQIDPLGEPFDPQQHEAMALLEKPDAEPNSVLEVMQKGYTLNGRLVRAAMVVVSKAAGKAEATQGACGLEEETGEGEG